MKRKTTHSSHENVASLGTADGTAARDDASRRLNAVQIEADLTGSAEEGGETRVPTDAARTAFEATTAMLQASKSQTKQPAQPLPAAAAVKKRYEYAWQQLTRKVHEVINVYRYDLNSDDNFINSFERCSWYQATGWLCRVDCLVFFCIKIPE